MASAWGILKARRMRGVDDRGNLYQFWYVTQELDTGERPLAGWWALRVPGSKLEALAQSGGNLVLTDRRLLWEPLRKDLRVAYGRHGSKAIINTVAKLQERAAPAAPLEWPLRGLQLAVADGPKVAVRITGTGMPPTEFYFAQGPAFRGSAEQRTEFIERISQALDKG